MNKTMNYNFELFHKKINNINLSLYIPYILSL